MPHKPFDRYLIAYCTCPADVAPEIARVLVRKRVAACVNVIPGLLSVYEWKGAIEEDAESLLVIKTREDRFRALEATIREVHPYETFELVAADVKMGSRAYLDWIDSVLGE
ncbi:MAG: divalent-cation tolerance protein CutA [Bryobacterales bacterium]|nr:divalent-cation tolerance protein CutA [Bryobacterales bacterium]